VLLIGSVVLGAAPALAYEAGGIILRVGAIGTLPTDDSENITPLVVGAQVEADADPAILF